MFRVLVIVLLIAVLAPIFVAAFTFLVNFVFGLSLSFLQGFILLTLARFLVHA